MDFERPFNLDINGRRVLRNFDICQAARGPQHAYERVFHYSCPMRRANSSSDSPWLGTDAKIKQAPCSIEVCRNCGPRSGLTRLESQFVDWNSFVWRPTRTLKEARFSVGRARHSGIATFNDQQLYRTARAGKEFRYRLAVPRGFIRPLKFRRAVAQRAGTAAHGHRSQRPARLEGVGSRRSRRQFANGADVRTEDVTPDKDGRSPSKSRAVRPNPAILQGIEVE